MNIPLTIHVISRPGGPPVVLGEEAEFIAYIRSRRGAIGVAEREIAAAQTEREIALSADDLTDAQREERLSRADTRIRSHRAEIAAARAAIEETERIIPDLRSLREQAEPRQFELAIPSWDEVARAEQVHTKSQPGGDGFIVDRPAAVASLLRTACPAAGREHPLIGRRLLAELWRHVYGETSDLPFLLGLLSPS